MHPNNPPSYNEATASSAGTAHQQDHKPFQPQPHQQPPYRAIVIERTAHVTPIFASEMERPFPMAALFFILGWVCPPLWIVGACCCMGSIHPYEAWWGSANLVMSIIFILSSIIYSSVIIANES